MTKAIDSAFRLAIEEGYFPAASILVSKNGKVVYENDFGAAREGTCFDIASLTKPFSTATLAMMLVSDGLLKLQDTVYQWLAGARQPAHKLITLRHLLNHTSGLPWWHPYYRELPMSLIGTDAGKQMIFENCYAEELAAETGTKTIYSDIGYMMLGKMIEEAGSSTLDELFAKKIAKPLGLSDTFFVKIKTGSFQEKGRSPAGKDQHVPVSKRFSERKPLEKNEHRRFAPTEDCPWRDRVISGEVHDQNTYALGGVSGQAGLFSTTHDLEIFSKNIVDCYYGKSDWISPEVVREFLGKCTKKPAGDEFALGWMRPSKSRSSSGHHFSPNTVGHLGFTGCSLWIDLDEDFRVILLTNRIHPSTTNEKIKTFRPYIHDLIYDELLRS